MKKRLPLKVPKLFSALLILLFFLSLNSCRKDNLPQEASKTPTQSDAVLAYIKSLGFKDADIRETATAYIVEGDIMFSKNLVVPALSKINSKDAKISQRESGFYIDSAITEIRVYVDPSGSAYITEIQDAMDAWNAANCRLYFTATTTDNGPYSSTNPGGYHTIIDFTDMNPVCGMASFPNGGKPGSAISIDPHHAPDVTTTIAHELGHIVGLAHTNTHHAFSLPVPGTPGSESSSIMNHVDDCADVSGYVTSYDIIAFQYLCGKYPPVPPPPPTGYHLLVDRGIYNHYYDQYGFEFWDAPYYLRFYSNYSYNNGFTNPVTLPDSTTFYYHVTQDAFENWVFFERTQSDYSVDGFPGDPNIYLGVFTEFMIYPDTWQFMWMIHFDTPPGALSVANPTQHFM